MVSGLIKLLALTLHRHNVGRTWLSLVSASPGTVCVYSTCVYQHIRTVCLCGLMSGLLLFLSLTGETYRPLMVFTHFSHLVHNLHFYPFTDLGLLW